MIERIDGMPEGTVGLRASGKLSKEDYTDALVTDAEWVAKAMHMFTWLTPGEVLIRDLDGFDEAKRWVAQWRFRGAGRWQRRELEADEDLAAGRVTRYEGDE